MLKLILVVNNYSCNQINFRVLAEDITIKNKNIFFEIVFTNFLFVKKLFEIAE